MGNINILTQIRQSVLAATRGDKTLLSGEEKIAVKRKNALADGPKK